MDPNLNFVCYKTVYGIEVLIFSISAEGTIARPLVLHKVFVDRGSWRLTPLVETTMLPSLPPEIFDHIVDHLHYYRTTLKACCLVSSSWIPRTRRHLFAWVDFGSPKSFAKWVGYFPDPSNSPAHHTRIISIHASAITLVTSSDALPWFRAFHLATRLELQGHWEDGGFSELVHLICSFPLLEDILLGLSVSDSNSRDAWDTPSSSPKLSGAFTLKENKIGPIIPRLLHLPGGVHFTDIAVACSIEVTQSVSDLVLRCSHTLESLIIRYFPPCAFPSSPVADLYLILVTDPIIPGKPTPLDLSKAQNLTHVEICSHTPDARWITRSLRSIEFKNLSYMEITLYPYSDREIVQREFENLDRLLVELFTSHSIVLKVVCRGRLLPRIMGREGVDASEM